MRLFLLTGYGVRRASPFTGSAAVALVGQNTVFNQGCASPGRTAVLFDVSLVFIAEIAQGGRDRVGSCLAETAKGTVPDDTAQKLKSLDVLHLALAIADLLEYLKHPLGAFPAGCALAA